MPYLDEFQQAIDLSGELGFSVQKPEVTETHYLTDEIQNRLHEWMLEVIGPEQDAHKLIGKCLANHLNAIGFVRKLVGVEPTFTLGYVTMDNENYHYFSEENLRGWAKNGLPDPTQFVGHAWLTLPSLEIIDFTFLATYAYVQYKKTGRNIGMGVLARHADEVQGIKYRPVAVGADIPGKIGALNLGIIVFPA